MPGNAPMRVPRIVVILRTRDITVRKLSAPEADCSGG